MTRDVDTDTAAAGADIAATLLRVAGRAAEQVEAASLKPGADPERCARAAGVIARSTSAILALHARSSAARVRSEDEPDPQTEEADMDDEERTVAPGRGPIDAARLERSMRNLERNLGPWAEHAERLAGADEAAAGGLGVASG